MKNYCIYCALFLLVGLFLPVSFYACTPLGATYSTSGTTFALWSPDTSDVELWLDGKVYPMQKIADCKEDGKTYTNVYATTINDNTLNLKPYHFLVNGTDVRDPYGKMVNVKNEDENIIIDADNIKPNGGWIESPPFNNPVDAIIYEMSVRDFTIDPNSGVDKNLQGTFTGMVQSGTHYTDPKTGQVYKTTLDHLKSLGITHIQLMPIFYFGSCSRAEKSDCYNWGYDPVHFNAPEWRYSMYEKSPYKSSPHYEDRIREVQTMVNEFHKAGIRVVMDVVHNHTYSKSVFEPITPKYYTKVDFSGCGNSLDDSNPMVAQMIQDSLEYWVRTYHVDGFRFDLLGIFNYKNVSHWVRYLNKTFPDRHLIFYGEPWNGGVYDPQELQKIRLGTISMTEYDEQGHFNPTTPVAVFNPEYRNALRGNSLNDGIGYGYIFNRAEDQWLGFIRIWQGLLGSFRAPDTHSSYSPQILSNLWDAQFANIPEETVNYVSAHDNLCLWDRIKKWATAHGHDPEREAAYLKRIDMFAIGIIMTSQGTAFFLGGDEILRDKKGNANSFDAPDSTNQINWEWLKNQDVFNYYQSVIKMRKLHPAFRMRTWNDINNYIKSDEIEKPPYIQNTFMTMIKNGKSLGDSWNTIIVFYNSAGNFTYTLPNNGNPWYIAMQKGEGFKEDGPVAINNQVEVEGTAVTVVYQK